MPLSPTALVQAPLEGECAPATNGHVNGSAHTQQKQRGGYYTPDAIASVLADWAIQDSSAHVLEPSAGDGQLVVAASRHVEDPGRIVAIELYPEEAEKVAIRGGATTEAIAGDFFTWFWQHGDSGSFDVVLGNPPFIRYQHFREDHREIAFRLMRAEGLHPSRLTNAWLPFVVGATRALRSGGRLALVLPAELLQVTYASELREYLARKYSHLTVVTFKELIFADILQETVLLLGIRQDTAAQIAFVELETLNDLQVSRINEAEEVEVDLNHAREKWTQYYLSPSELGLIRELEDADAFGRLGWYAEVDVGVVTGRNEFFVLARDESDRLGILEWCLPLVGRSSQIPGLVLRREEWEALAAANGKCLLLQLGDAPRLSLSPSALSYVEAGEQRGYHEGYKCRIRLPHWWKVPSDWAPEAFMLRQIYDGPRIIENRAGATSTDTIHRIRMKNGVDPSWLAAASMNSLTWAFAEIRGRSYGGGVLELEPTEAEGLPFPTPGTVNFSVDDLDHLARQTGSEGVLNAVDRTALISAGLTKHDVSVLREIWRKLHRRRMSRKRR
ncbi:MAG: N-6 DNA methylase [Candidatus Binatia bacterium]